MVLAEIVAAAAAGIGCGSLNALVGGGTLISFPVLMALGVAPVSANATNTVALSPGYLSAAVAQREQLSEQRHRIRRLMFPAALGGTAGAALLLATSDDVFRLVVPVLLGMATALLAMAPRLRAWTGHASRSAATGDARWLPIATGAVAVYGGFFGAGIGIMLLAVLGVGVHQTLTRSNALKQVLSLTTNTMAAALFVAVALSGSLDVRWDLAAALAAGNVAGGQIGGRISRRLDPERFRWIVIGTGAVLTCVYAVREYS